MVSGMVEGEAAAEQPDRLFYDGGCALCHRAVSFVARRDPDGSGFRFAPLGGETFQALIAEEHRNRLPDSLVVLTAGGPPLVRSAALKHILRRLGGSWALISRILGLLPAAVADRAYDLIARRRLRWFGQSGAVCPALPEDLRRRFDP